MEDALTVLGTGLGVVFIGLISLIGIIYLMSFFVRLARKDDFHSSKKHVEVEPDTQGFVPPVSLAAEPLKLTGEKRRETIAAISAAVAEYLGEGIDGFRIHSVKRVGSASGELSPEKRRELIAVISTAIAEEMGEDVSAIRIASIRKAA